MFRFRRLHMRLGLQFGLFSPGKYGNHFDSLLAVAQACERAGLDSVWMADHFMFPDKEQPEKEVPVMECFSVLAAVAATTSRIRIGELVAGVPYRNPALFSKICATLDVISHGRSMVGLGAAWHQAEFEAYGWPFPPLSDRFKMLEEAVQIVDRMMTQRPATFSGKYYSVQNAYNDPLPVQKPRPPIMIGGSGERVTLRLVAQYADFSNVGGDPGTVAHKFEVLRQHCATVGRQFDDITLCNHVGMLIARNEADLAVKKERHTDFEGITGTPEVVVSRLREYAAAGSQYITFNLADSEDIDAIHLIGEAVLPHVAEI
jgi:F420-dependent oxidoreductase-like protein